MAFIKARDEKAWRSVLNGWKHPITKDAEGKEILKPEGSWNSHEDKLAIYNSRALNAIFNGVDINQFKMISTSNESFALGEKIPKVKLVSKTLRSLPQRFAYKVIAIEEAKNTQTIRLDELMGSLKTFEMNLSQNKKEKEISQGIAFQAEVKDNVEEEDEDLEESLARLTKNFNRSECANTLKKRKKSFNVTWSDEDSEGNQEDDDHVNNYVAFNVFEDVSNCSVTNRVTAHVVTSSATHSGKPEENRDFSDSGGSSDGEELTEETIQEAYETMFNKWVLVVKKNKSLRERVDELIKENDVLKRATVNYEFQAVENEKKLQETRAELEHTQKSLKIMNSGTTKLDHILSIGKASGDRHGLGYIGESSTSKKVFVKKTSAPKPPTSSSKKTIISFPRHKKFVPTCHYCNLPGYISSSN
ncbi:uncharacterized protein LOC112094406 [Morus notabilis]|uniref:uncharacterized protein LOC112094406 n=1 Tax=Morus notabilis TaxID=981085 RepID=UPI000CED3291|nr:uncharacterized protein LOC112094406 [Morus notabilis]